MQYYKEQKSLLDDSWKNFMFSLNQKVPDSEGEAWVNQLVLEKLDSDKIIFSGLNKFFTEYVEKNYSGTIRNLIKIHFNSVITLDEGYKVLFLLKNYYHQTEEQLPSPEKPTPIGLNEVNSFDRFIDGANTKIAYACALAVSEYINTPKYNPLFICGSVGLGKTHLMQAIGNKVLQKFPYKKILYCSAEGFTNNIIEGIRFGKTHEMRKKYRNLDLLLIDDIQFLENKFSTQEEFFHTFNELILNNKQVVIAADRFPREIKNIEERLISRFSSGMVAKIETPDFETRFAIVKNEISIKNLTISEEIISHIAHTVKSNVREIKGVLTKLEAEKSLLGLDLTLKTTRAILKEILDLDKRPISIDEITKLVADELYLKKVDLLSEKRDRDISNARQMAMYISRQMTNLSYPVIGRYFSKNHTSVIQANRKVKLLMKENSESSQFINSLIRRLSDK
ncbi:MAG: chromosomal replication initiator protein DnaA [SAR324 cluster bacterium]|nr:chromosomal replication initiator protein DnaA [SAR324 cluster bacterium]